MKADSKGYKILPGQPDGLIPTGYENKGRGLLETNLARSEAPIKGASAITVAVPAWYSDQRILNAAGEWNQAAKVSRAPVIVTSDSAKIWVFTGEGNEPFEYVPW